MLRYISAVPGQGLDRRERGIEQDMNGSIDRLAPGTFVRSPANPDWGLGQVQSAVGHKVTVNFEHRGKLVLNTASVALTAVEPPASPQRNK